MSDAFQPTFEYFFDTVKPGVPDGTRIDEISLRPRPRPVTAVTVTSPVMSVPALVMNALVPLITHSSPSSEAGRWSGRPRVRATAGLGQPERAEHLPVHSAAATRLLLVGAEAVDRHRAQRHGRLQRDGHRRVDPASSSIARHSAK